MVLGLVDLKAFWVERYKCWKGLLSATKITINSLYSTRTELEFSCFADYVCDGICVYSAGIMFLDIERSLLPKFDRLLQHFVFSLG
jgi:hypothetical protein